MATKTQIAHAVNEIKKIYEEAVKKLEPVYVKLVSDEEKVLALKNGDFKFDFKKFKQRGDHWHSVIIFPKQIQLTQEYEQKKLDRVNKVSKLTVLKDEAINTLILGNSPDVLKLLENFKKELRKVI